MASTDLVQGLRFVVANPRNIFIFYSFRALLENANECDGLEMS